MIWNQVKGQIARENKTFKLSDIKDLVIQGTEKVSVQNGMSCINQVTEKKRDVGKIDGLDDEMGVNQNLIISINSDSIDSNSEQTSMEDL
ncbi:hypothetical protein NPIL_643901 [Nephila pilipes]|uniref:Uncharacterized protein n=1 Tax=Nephila pilipes TaxID=299642 RepID=A0A8X6MHN2_NEPPI|nr:hypothetical protein NPIL_643901 [Nephila pilipes]